MRKFHIKYAYVYCIFSAIVKLIDYYLSVGQLLQKKFCNHGSSSLLFIYFYSPLLSLSLSGQHCFDVSQIVQENQMTVMQRPKSSLIVRIVISSIDIRIFVCSFLYFQLGFFSQGRLYELKNNIYFTYYIYFFMQLDKIYFFILSRANIKACMTHLEKISVFYGQLYVALSQVTSPKFFCKR